MTPEKSEEDFDRQSLLAELAPTILAGLTGALDHDDPAARHIAIVNLGRTGEAGLAAAARLATIARHDPKLELRKEAVTALRDIGLRALPWLLPLVNVGESEIADLSRQALQDLKTTPRQRVEKLMELLTDPDVYVRRQAMVLLTDIFTERFATTEIEINSAHFQTLDTGARKALNDVDDLVRLGAASLIYRVRRDSTVAPVAEAIALQVEHPQRELANQLLMVMGRRLPTARAADSNVESSPLGPLVETLLQDLRDSSSNSADWASTAFFHFSRSDYVPDDALTAITRIVQEAGGHSASYVDLYTLSRVAHRFPDVHGYLVEALQHHSEHVRWGALEWLEQCLPFPEAALPKVARALQDSDEYVASRAARLLLNRGEQALPFLADLRRAAETATKAENREYLLEVIGILNPVPAPTQLSPEAQAEACRKMADSDPAVRIAAINEAGHPGNVVPLVVDALVRRVMDSDGTVSSAAFQALKRMGPAVQPLVISALLKFPPDEDVNLWRYRLPMRASLALIDSSNHKILAELAKILSDYVRRPAGHRRLLEHHRRFLKLLDDSDPDVVRAAEYLVRQFPPLEDEVEWVLSRTESDMPERSAAAFGILMQWGAVPDVIIPRLVDLLVNEQFVWHARRALEQNGRLASVSLLLFVRRRGPMPPVLLKPLSKDAVPLLCAFLGDPDPEMRKESAESLCVLGSDAADAVPALLRVLQDQRIGNIEDSDQADWALRYSHEAALRTLQRIGPAARAAIPALEALSLDDTSDLSESVKEALRGITAEPGIARDESAFTPEQRRAAIESAQNPQRGIDLEEMLYRLSYLKPIDAQIAEIFLNYASDSDRKTRDAGQAGVHTVVAAEQAYWQERLRHADVEQRLAAVRNLSQFVPHEMSPESIAEWERAACDAEPIVRAAVAKALGRFTISLAREEDPDENAQRFVLGTLMALYGDKSEPTANAAAEAIAALNGFEIEHPGQLRQWLPDPDRDGGTFGELLRRGATSNSAAGSKMDPDWLDQQADRLSDAHPRKGKHKK